MDKYNLISEEIELFADTDIEYMTKNDLITLHDNQVYQFGGILGVRDEALLDSVSKAPYQGVFGQELYPTVFDKAAKYLFDFANYQIFLDGNKRTGLSTATMLLEMNGYELDMDFSEVYDLTMQIANGKITEIADVSKILEENAVQIEMENDFVIE